jgi:hypothetical protein
LVFILGGEMDCCGIVVAGEKGFGSGEAGAEDGVAEIDDLLDIDGGYFDHFHAWG